jgi:hypothetical protein
MLLFLHCLGYSKGSFGVVYLAEMPTSREQMKWDADAIKTLDGLQSDFIRICRKRGILKRHLGLKKSSKDFNLVGEGLSEWQPYAEDVPKDVIELCRKFHLSLFYKIYSLRKSRASHAPIGRTRARIPNEIAWELFKILHFSVGDVQALRTLYNFLAHPDGMAKLMENRSTAARTEIIKMLTREKKQSEGHLREYKGRTHIIKRIKGHISTYEDEIHQVQNKSIKWNIAGHRADRNKNTLWANHLKEHLIRVLLSKGKPKIIKKLSREQKKEKDRLIQLANEENNLLIRGLST